MVLYTHGWIMSVHSIKEFFGDLQFVESTHTYTVDGKVLPSVSTKIEQYYKQFDSDTISKNYARKHETSQELVLAEWKRVADEACVRGHKAHEFGELYAFDRTIEPTTPLEESIVTFWNKLPDYIVPGIMELQMYHKKYMYSGTGDIVLFNKKKKSFILGDYKTNKDLFKNFQEQKMLGVFSDLLDHPYNHYQVQLSYYQILLEQLGIPITQRFILWLRDDGTYQFYNTYDLTVKLRRELEAGR